MKILITGGAGFIGSHIVRLFANKYPSYQILTLDALTYAGNLENLTDVLPLPNHRFIKGDITDGDFISALFAAEAPDAVIHLAAESHVDRSIEDPLTFVHTNVLGTVHLLRAARALWQNPDDGTYAAAGRNLFYHVSTDEVYGSLPLETSPDSSSKFTESSPYAPHSPYSASKAAADHFVRAWAATYDLPVKISNCSNNYGPFQFPEKLIPLALDRLRRGLKVPVYGTGENVRDWLYVGDHADAVDVVFHEGREGETYNIGGGEEWANLELVRVLCGVFDEVVGTREGGSEVVVEVEERIEFVEDRKGHDLRYAVDCGKIRGELGWSSRIGFREGLKKTVEWYVANEGWLERVTSGEYKEYYERQYGVRG